MHYKNLSHFMLLVALPAVVLATGCAHQPTLKRAARPFLLTGRKCPTAPLAVINDSSLTPSIAPVTVENPQPRPAFVQTSTTPRRTSPQRLPTVATVAAPESSRLTHPIQQTSANDTTDNETPATVTPRYNDLQAARLPTPIRSNDLTTGNLPTGKAIQSFGFNDLQRDDAPPVSVKVPPSMKTQESTATWSTPHRTDLQLNDVSVESLENKKQ